MSKLARNIIILIVAAAITIGVFSALGKITEPSPVVKPPPLSTEVTFEKEYTSENFERPPAPDTKGRGYKVYSTPDFPEPDLNLPPCSLHDTIKPCAPVLEFKLNDPPPSNPIFRPPPIFPENATRSGSCKFKVQIDEQGKPTAIDELKCNDPVFVQSTQKAVMKWRFRPKVEKGELVRFTASDQKIIYRLLEEDGNLIPE